ncbi:MAG TPA: sigma-70 family RNA polymerase sigma factor [Gemmataceae bacterium]|nr:sigma-70 family RNA polymerase sigma factor [Gemmataceae bacterium]
MEPQSFAELWKAYQAGDASAQNRVLTSFTPRIMGLVKKFLRNKNLNEDVTQSILTSFIASHIDKISIEKPDELWQLFAAITLRHCGKHNKRAFRETQRGRVVSIGRAEMGGEGDSLPGFEPTDDELTPEVQVALDDLFEQCRRELSERQQQVLGMHLASMDRQEISDTLQVAIPTVDRELKKIRTVLARLVGAQEN